MEHELDDLTNGGNETIEQDDNNLMHEFVQKLDSAQRLVELIKENDEKVELLKIRYIKATTSSVEKEISKKLDYHIQTNSKYNEQLKDIMISIADDVDRAKESQPNEPQTRMMLDMQNVITLKVQETLKSTQSVQLDFRSSVRNKISRQTKLLDSNLTEEQVQEICDDPEKAQELMQQKLYGSSSVQLQNDVAEIQDKYRDILKLENSINALFQLFQDLALLVHNQGQVIDNIELNMNPAKNYVAQGEKILMKEKEAQKAARKVQLITNIKKMCCIVIIGLVVAVLGTQF